MKGDVVAVQYTKTFIKAASSFDQPVIQFDTAFLSPLVSWCTCNIRHAVTSNLGVTVQATSHTSVHSLIHSPIHSLRAGRTHVQVATSLSELLSSCQVDSGYLQLTLKCTHFSRCMLFPHVQSVPVSFSLFLSGSPFSTLPFPTGS